MKFKSAKHKREYEENQRAWNALMDKYKPKEVKNAKQNLSDVYQLSAPAGRTVSTLPSRSTPGGSTAPRQTFQYSGTAMKGIGVMHKSNAVPVFSDDEAKELASMRR